MGRKALKRLRKRKLKKSVKRPPDDTLTPNFYIFFIYVMF